MSHKKWCEIKVCKYLLQRPTRHEDNYHINIFISKTKISNLTKHYFFVIFYREIKSVPSYISLGLPNGKSMIDLLPFQWQNCLNFHGVKSNNNIKQTPISSDFDRERDWSKPTRIYQSESNVQGKRGSSSSLSPAVVGLVSKNWRVPWWDAS